MAAGKTQYELMLEIAGNLDKSYVHALQSATDQIKKLSAEEEASLSPSQRLRREIREQEIALRDAKKRYMDVAIEQGENSREAKELKAAYDKLNSELGESKDKLSSVEKTLDGVSESTSKTGTAIGTFIGGVGVKLVEWGINAAKSVWQLADSTREYRRIAASMKSAATQHGYTTQQTAESYSTLYNVLGDQQSAATTTSNLQALGLEQSKLQTLTDSVIGAWARYGDSIPIDGLAEAVNETVKTGKVTGAFADVLNWAGQSEDAFNSRLAGMSSEAARANAIMQMMADQGLAAAGAAWQENNKSLVEANKAQAAYDDQIARIGQSMEPMTTAVKSGIAGLLGQIAKAMEGANMTKVINGISSAFQLLTPILSTLLSLVQSNFSIIGEAATTIMPTIQSIIVSLIPIIQQLSPILSEVSSVALSLLGPALQLLQPIIAAVMSFLPVIQQMAASILPALSSAVSALSPVLSYLGQIVGSALSSAFQLLTPVIQSATGVITGLLNFVRDVFTGNWRSAWQNIVNTFGAIWSTIKGVVKAPINGVISLINGAISRINKVSVTIPDWVPGLGGKTFGMHVPTIPMLAQGGIVTAPTLAMIGEGGEPEAVTPLSKLERMVDNSQSSVTYAPNIYVSGNASKSDIASALDDGYEKFKVFMSMYRRETVRLSI